MREHYQPRPVRRASAALDFLQALILAGRMSVPADNINYGETIYEQLQNL